jgi:hypothetical protein
VDTTEEDRSPRDWNSDQECHRRHASYHLFFSASNAAQHYWGV